MQLSKEATLLYIVLRQPFMDIKRTSKRYLCSMVSSGWMTYKLNANSFQEKTVPIRYHLFIHSHDRGIVSNIVSKSTLIQLLQRVNLFIICVPF